MMEKIRQYLTEKLGYKDYEIDITIKDLEEADEDSRQMLLKHMAGEDVTNYAFRDYSVKRLMNEKGMNIVASVLAISHLKQNYDYYSALYRRPFK